MTILNSIWNFFASVKLAIFTLCFLALTSVIGTLIPQGKEHAYYAKQYGVKIAQFFDVLSIPDMYYSWWFTGLLGLLSANLIICSFDRFPNVWRIMKKDNLVTTPERLKKMRESSTWQIGNARVEPAMFTEILHKLRWKTVSTQLDGGELYFSQKGAWSRTGVYLVHLSILFIFAGAIVGHHLGFKGSVMIPETQSTTKIYPFDKTPPIELGFEVRCDSFAIEYYENGMPKEYESHLTVLEDGKTVLQKKIEVNGPLTYKGITFYQSSYEGFQDFLINVKDNSSGEYESFVVPFQKQKLWKEKNLHFGIINAEAVGDRVVRSKVWVKAGNSSPVIEWLEGKKTFTVKDDEHEYTIAAKQMYATGLQVAKDPGVWLVYFGCGLMMIGLYVAFFLSHKRVWLYTKEDSGNVSILLAGSTNKNKIGFAKQFSELANSLKNATKK